MIIQGKRLRYLGGGQSTRMNTQLRRCCTRSAAADAGYVIEPAGRWGTPDIYIRSSVRQEQIIANTPARRPGLRGTDRARGTGHAVMMCRQYLQARRPALILCGDAPLIRKETLQILWRAS